MAQGDPDQQVLLQLAQQQEMTGAAARAEQTYRQILSREPKQVDALSRLAALQSKMGRHQAAVEMLKRAVAARPKSAELHFQLGELFFQLRQFDKAAVHFREGLARRPGYARAWLLLGNCLKKQGDLDEAARCMREGVNDPKNPAPWDAWTDLGSVLILKGRVAEALACFRETLRQKPDHVFANDNLLYDMHFDAESTVESILQAHQKWDQAQAEALRQKIEPHTNDLNPDRRLRIGYVSPDFNAHVVGRFIAPLIGAHDKEAFEIYCYSSTRGSDPILERTRHWANVWREVGGLNDEQLATQVRRDGIDILVDLTMHMRGGRLLMFARKPAPVQVAYLAYVSTTGLEAMDYRISDVHLDSPADDAAYTEKTIRLPKTYWCYEPVAMAPEIGGVPSARSGFVTFGCLNNFCKVSDGALMTWGRLMAGIPNSRLILHCLKGSQRGHVLEVLGRSAVTPDRVEFMEFGLFADYFGKYQRIDVALDPFPYAGGTTTLDALWMGVPVVTLRGKTAVGRGGVSILTNAGLPDLITASEEEYVHVAATLAADVARRSDLRATLRTRLRTSPLLDAAGFARDMEAAYRQMWRNHCTNAANG